MLKIRPAQSTDRADVVRLWHQGWHDAHAALVPPEVLSFRTIEHFNIWLKEASDDFYVAMSGDIVGFVTVEGPEVVKLYVDRNVRGQGVAHQLLSFAELHLSKNGVREAELFCTAGNGRAENFYRREGWTLIQTFEDALWIPEGISARFAVQTHRFQKNLVPSTPL